MYKYEIQSAIRKDIEQDDIIIKTVVLQDTIWPDHVEVRAFAENGKVFSTLYDGDNQVTPYVEVEQKKEAN